MQFYAAANGFIPASDMKLFRRICWVIENLPDATFDPEDRSYGSCTNQMTCHLLCRALANYFGVSYADGQFCGRFEHSWLLPPSRKSIIDAYPVACAQPFIVAIGDGPWFTLYHNNPDKKLLSRLHGHGFERRLKLTDRMVENTASKAIW